MEKQELIRYRAFADALIRLNNATTTLLNEGADPDAIKLILTGTAQLFAELESKMFDPEADSDEQQQDNKVPLSFDDSSSTAFTIPTPSKPSLSQTDDKPKADPQS
jgi:hypothetical protein